MRIAATKPLFAWDCLEDSPTVKTIKQFLKSVPDAKLLACLRRWRGRGRDDYPVSVLWGAMLLTILLRHQSVESCLGELRRNATLRRLIGIGSEEQVPRKWNMSRFMKVLGTEPHLSLLHEVFDRMVRRLAEAVKDLGVQTAGDASGLSARLPRGKKDSKNSSLPQPTCLPAGRPEDERNTPTNRAISQGSSSGSATSSTCWWTHPTKWPWPIRSPRPTRATTRSCRIFWPTRSRTCRPRSPIAKATRPVPACRQAGPYPHAGLRQGRRRRKGP